jgi:acyl-CoA hydrolase
MEIFVQSYARKVTVGKNYLINEAYFSFVAIDESGKKTPVIPVKPVTAGEKTAFAEALLRKNKLKKNKPIFRE